ncbi:hypothetical protein BS78_09G088300 [Paspalum vaginatum]|nr:hypothetical protein BS78_09G088300 [Paspalum vaginatum]
MNVGWLRRGLVVQGHWGIYVARSLTRSTGADRWQVILGACNNRGESRGGVDPAPACGDAAQRGGRR